MSKSSDELAIEYALLVPENANFGGRMYVSALEEKANDLFDQMAKASDPVTASAAILQARSTLRMVDALPKDAPKPHPREFAFK